MIESPWSADGPGPLWRDPPVHHTKSARNPGSSRRLDSFEKVTVQVTKTAGIYEAPRTGHDAAVRRRTFVKHVALRLPPKMREGEVQIVVDLTRGYSPEDLTGLGRFATRLYERDLARGRPRRSAFEYLLVAIYVKRLREGGN